MDQTYAEKLQNPKWQRRRLEIFNRDNFTCVQCGDKENTLHVHHLKYSKGKEPWEYPDVDLQTLCATCHAKRHIVPAQSTLTKLKPEVYEAISAAVCELAEWFNSTNGESSIQEQSDFVLKYKASNTEHISNDFIVISALYSIANTIADELKTELDYRKQINIIRRVKAVRQLRAVVASKSGIFHPGIKL